MQKKIIYLIITICTMLSMCTTMISAKDDYTPVAEGVYNKHTYQMFDDSLTWEEATGYANATIEQALIIATRMAKNLK